MRSIYLFQSVRNVPIDNLKGYVNQAIKAIYCQTLFISVPIFSITSLVRSIKLGSVGTFSLAFPSKIIGDLLLVVLIRCLNCDLSSLFSILSPFHSPFSEYATDIIPIFISFMHHRSQVPKRLCFRLHIDNQPDKMTGNRADAVVASMRLP